MSYTFCIQDSREKFYNYNYTTLIVIVCRTTKYIIISLVYTVKQAEQLDLIAISAGLRSCQPVDCVMSMWREFWIYRLKGFRLTDVPGAWALDNQHSTVVSYQPFGKYFYYQIMVIAYTTYNLKYFTK